MRTGRETSGRVSDTLPVLLLPLMGLTVGTVFYLVRTRGVEVAEMRTFL